MERNDRGAIMAGSTLIAVPVMIFFVLVQRRLCAGLVAGAVKGMTVDPAVRRLVDAVLVPGCAAVAVELLLGRRP